MAESQEYDLIQHTKLTFEEATPEFFAAESQKHNKQPCAIIVDDYAYADMNKKEKANAYKMVQHACTHLNFTCWLASHSLTQLVPRLRRACDINNRRLSQDGVAPTPNVPDQPGEEAPKSR